MAADFGTVDDAFLDHNTLHLLQRHGGGGEIHIPAPPSTEYSSEDGETLAGGQVEKCVSLLQEVAEEWKQQNAYDKTPGKELLQRQIETLHAVRRHYLDELIHYLERVQAAQHS
jgi:hypothetical protein